MSDYTKGEWQIIEGNEEDYDYIAKLGDYLILTKEKDEGKIVLGDVKADAQLIATAPELLEVAEEIINESIANAYTEYISFEISAELLGKLEEVTSKAKGELNA